MFLVLMLVLPPGIAVPEPIVTIRVRYGSFAPAAVLMTVRVEPHPDNRRVCWGLRSTDGDAMLSCRDLTGDSPKTQPLITYPNVSAGHYEAFAEVYRVPSPTSKGGIAGREIFHFRVRGIFDEAEP